MESKGFALSWGAALLLATALAAPGVARAQGTVIVGGSGHPSVEVNLGAIDAAPGAPGTGADNVSGPAAPKLKAPGASTATTPRLRLPPAGGAVAQRQAAPAATPRASTARATPARTEPAPAPASERPARAAQAPVTTAVVGSAPAAQPTPNLTPSLPMPERGIIPPMGTLPPLGTLPPAPTLPPAAMAAAAPAAAPAPAPAPAPMAVAPPAPAPVAQPNPLPPARPAPAPAPAAAPAAAPAPTRAAAPPPAPVRQAAVQTQPPQTPPRGGPAGPAVGTVADADLSLNFAAGSADLSAEGARALDATAQRLAGADTRIQLRAHSAATGPDNLSGARRLSLSRALAVRTYLIDKGVRSTRIDVRALGPAESGAPDRVDIITQAR